MPMEPALSYEEVSRRMNKSLLIFSYTNPVRKICRLVTTSKTFEFLILASIAANCVVLALNERLPGDDFTSRDQLLEQAELPFICIFATEVLLKIIHQGFLLHSGAFMRSAWNILDIFIVATGILSLPQLGLLPGSALKALRVLRVLRPLKFASLALGLQAETLVQAFLRLGKVALLLFFVIFIYSIIALQTFSGLFHYGCFHKNTGRLYAEGFLCGSKQGRQCSEDYECRRYIVGPNFGITTFDNIYLAALAVLQVVTSEGWTEILNWTKDVYDAYGVGIWIFYYSLYIISVLFMLNFLLGVLSAQYGRRRWHVRSLRQLEEISRTSDRTMAEAKQPVEPEIKSGSIRSSLFCVHQHKETEIDPKPKIKTSIVAIPEESKRELGTNSSKSPPPYSSEKSEIPTIEGFVIVNTEVVTLCCCCRKTLQSKEVMDAKRYSGCFPADSTQHQHEHQQEQQRQPVCRKIIDTCFLPIANFVLAFRRLMQTIIQTKIFNYIMLICAMLNAVALATIKHSNKGAFRNVSHLSAICFMLEAGCGLFAFGCRTYLSSKRNMWHSFLSLLGAIDLTAVFVANIETGLLALQTLRLVEVIEISPWRDRLANLVDLLISVGKTIWSLIILLLIFILIFALLGQNLFGGKFAKLHPIPRTNFNDFWSSVLATIQLLTGEKWNQVLYDGIRSYGGVNTVAGLVAPIFFVAIILIGKFFLLNVFLVITLRHVLAGWKTADTSSFDDLTSIGTASEDGGSSPDMVLERSLFLFSPSCTVRRWIYAMVSWRLFDPIILVCIMASSVLLAFEDVVHEKAPFNTVVLVFDFIFTPLFTIELILKIINSGLVLHKGAFLRSGWNVFDAIVVCSSIIALVLTNLANPPNGVKKTAKIVKFFRVLRPLKSINKSQKLKDVFQCLLKAVGSLFMVVLLSAFIIFTFALVGVQLFHGQFSYCTDTSKQTAETCKGKFITFDKYDYYQPMELDRKWLTHSLNFENVAQGMASLFAVATFEEWPSIMYQAIDSTEVGKGPTTNSRPAAALFFIIFLSIAALVVVNLYVAVVVLTYQVEEARRHQGSLLNRNERKCLHFALRSKPVTLYESLNVSSFRRRLLELVSREAFDRCIMVLVVLNSVALTIEYDGQSSEYEWWLDKISEWFNFIFTVEAVFKLAAFHLHYFHDKWNVFDFALVLISWSDFVVSRTVSKQNVPFDTGLFRLFRALRVIKILNRSRSFKVLILSFAEVLRVLPYIGLLVLLVLFIYSVLGKYLFSHIDLKQSDKPWSMINRNSNFRTFFSSVQLLVRCGTGEDWPLMMAACSTDAKCDMSLGIYKDGESCGTSVSYLYFLSYVFLMKFVILNFFVAVVIDNISFLSPDESVLGPHELDDFVTAWSEFDPRGTGFIRHNEACDLLRQLRPPLGMGKLCPKTKLYSRMVSMNMFLRDDGSVGFNAMFFQLCRTSLRVYLADNNLKSHIRTLRWLIRTNFPDIQKYVIDATVPKERHQRRCVATLYSAKLIYENYKHIQYAKQRIVKRQSK